MKKFFLVIGIIFVVIFIFILTNSFSEKIFVENENQKFNPQEINQIILYNTLPIIENSFANKEVDSIVGQRLNITNFKTTSLTWKIEKGAEPAKGTITSQILTNADDGTNTEKVVATADQVLIMEDLPIKLKEHTFTFSNAPFLTGEVVFALKFEFTSEPFCCAIARHQLLDNSAEGQSTSRSVDGNWNNAMRDEGLKIIGVQKT